MNVHISYKTGKTPEIEREFQHQLKRLETRLQVYKPDLVHFHAIVDKLNSHGISISLNLRLPSAFPLWKAAWFTVRILGLLPH